MTKIIDSTQCDPRFLRVHPDHSQMPTLSRNVQQQIRRDIQHYGIHSPLIVTRQRTIIDGALRKQVAQECGWATVPIVVLDVSEDVAFRFMVEYNKEHRPLSLKQSRDYAKLLPLVLREISGDEAMRLLSAGCEQDALPLPTPQLDREDPTSFQMFADRHENPSTETPLHSSTFALQSPLDDWLMALGALMWAQNPVKCWNAVVWKMIDHQGFIELLAKPTDVALEPARQKILMLLFALINHRPILSIFAEGFSVPIVTADYPAWSALKRRAQLLESLSYGDRLWDHMHATYFSITVANPS